VAEQLVELVEQLQLLAPSLIMATVLDFAHSGQHLVEVPGVPEQSRERLKEWVCSELPM
jgi:hypothetical protein